MQETGVQNIKILPKSWNCSKLVREKFPLKRFPVVNMHIFTLDRMYLTIYLRIVHSTGSYEGKPILAFP